MKIAQLLLIHLFVFNCVYAQTGIKGTLKDAQENTPIEYGSIGLFSLNDSSLINGAVTQPNGTFELKGIKPGNYYLSIQ